MKGKQSRGAVWLSEAEIMRLEEIESVRPDLRYLNKSEKVHVLLQEAFKESFKNMTEVSRKKRVLFTPVRKLLFINEFGERLLIESKKTIEVKQ
jgi:hypothetical protein